MGANTYMMNWEGMGHLEQSQDLSAWKPVFAAQAKSYQERAGLRRGYMAGEHLEGHAGLKTL